MGTWGCSGSVVFAGPVLDDAGPVDVIGPGETGVSVVVDGADVWDGALLFTSVVLLPGGAGGMGELVVLDGAALDGAEFDGAVGPTLGVVGPTLGVVGGAVVMGASPPESVVEHPSNKRPKREPYLDVCIVVTQGTLAYPG